MLKLGLMDSVQITCMRSSRKTFGYVDGEHPCKMCGSKQSMLKLGKQGRGALGILKTGDGKTGDESGILDALCMRNVPHHGARHNDKLQQQPPCALSLAVYTYKHEGQKQ